MPIAKTRLETLQISKLLQCVREKDKEQIEKLTINGVPHLINYNEPNDGETAISIAAVANDDDMIEFLLELGAHPDVVDFKGRSAVMRSAYYGHLQCMEKLAKAKADMKLKDVEGKGVIFYSNSSTERHQKCLEIALARGAEVNNVDDSGMPAFVFACETAKENEEMCKMLLKKGSDPNIINEKTHRTALMAACSSGSAVVTKEILMRGAEVNENMLKVKIHAAHEAAKGGHLDCLQILSAYGALFDQYTDKGFSPIHMAAENGHAMCCKFLSQRGCNPKSKNKEGEQAKGLAKENGHKEAMKICRKAEKSFGKVGKNNEPWALAMYDFTYGQQSALLDLFKKFDTESTGTILKDDFLENLENMGAPMPEETDLKKLLMPHEKTRDCIDYNDFLTGKKYVNKQYLMSAFEGKKKKKKKGGGKKKKGKTKIPLPICTQADGPRTDNGGPPEQFIPRHIHFTDTNRFDRDLPPTHPLQDDSAWYLHHPEKTWMNINDASRNKDTDTLKDALVLGTNIDTKDKYFKTPLMVACLTGKIDVIRFLLDNGASVNAADNFKWTSLHFAAHAGLKDVVELLLERGADMEARTLCEATPLMRAIESSKPDVVQLLIDRGAKVLIENRKGQNPVNIAAAWADARVYDIVKAKYDSYPPPSDKKGKGKKDAKSPPKKSAPKDGKEAQKPPSPQQENIPPRRKGSILRAASALAGGFDEDEDITYQPLKKWTDQPTTQDLLCERVIRRERYTWEVDFEDFKMPFLKNVANRVEEFGGFDED